MPTWRALSADSVWNVDTVPLGGSLGANNFVDSKLFGQSVVPAVDISCIGQIE